VARNEISIEAPREAVFDVLADPRSYCAWVVGSREIRAADRNWPAAGTGFDHSVGLPPLLIKDETTVLRSRPPELLELRAKARPFPSAHVTLELRRERGGTRVTMIEDPALPLLRLLAGPLGHAAIRFRNAESLRRLKALVEEPGKRPGGRLPQRSKSPAPARTGG
jgi:uncharacterized protein YndB with AHSA1/START domain